MKAITIRQPWASLLVYCPAGHDRPVKRVETRSWAPPAELVGADIAIHAGAVPMSHVPEMPDIPFPKGCVIGIGRFLSVWQVGDLRGRFAACGEVYGNRVRLFDVDAFGHWGVGRIIWRWSEIDVLPEPKPAKGRQRLWEWKP